MRRSVTIHSKAVSSKELADQLGVSPSRYKVLTELVDASLSKLQPQRKTVVRVEPFSGGWSVTSGEKRATKRFTKKTDAVAAARSLARSAKPASLIVLRQNGGVQETAQYGDSDR